MQNKASIALGAFLFAIANPCFIFPNGFAIAAWFYYVPVFFLVHNSSFKKIWFYGGIYAALSFALYVYWMALRSSYTLAFFFVIAVYFFYYAAVFVLLKAADVFFERAGFFVECLILVFAEYRRTTGFLGMNYGVTGYTQWKFPIMIASAQIGGVWLVSFIVIFSSAVIYKIILDARLPSPIIFLLRQQKPAFWHSIMISTRKNILLLSALAVLFVSNIIFGVSSQHDWSTEKSVRAVAVQNNSDPWAGGFEAYKKDVEKLKRLTDAALTQDDNIKLVIWPETAVVPSIMLHYTERKDRDRFELAKSLLNYIEEKDAVFVLGNGHSVSSGGAFTDDYNAALVFTPKKNTLPPRPEIYAKQHLVPFTEYFPYEKKFQKIAEMIFDGDTHLWKPGTEQVVFKSAGLAFSTPICFEDTFGDDCRKMVLHGARAFVNMSNDAWSYSHACQNQHLAMAVFRCVENKIPAARSTASGETCFIDPNGKITARAEPFAETFAIGDIPIIEEKMNFSTYTKYGDFFPKLCAIAVCLMFVIRLATLKQHKKSKENR